MIALSYKGVCLVTISAAMVAKVRREEHVGCLPLAINKKNTKKLYLGVDNQLSVVYNKDNETLGGAT